MFCIVVVLDLMFCLLIAPVPAHVLPALPSELRQEQFVAYNVPYVPPRGANPARGSRLAAYQHLVTSLSRVYQTRNDVHVYVDVDQCFDFGQGTSFSRCRCC